MPTASGPDLRALLRDLPTLRDDPLGYFVRLDREHGPIARLPFGPRRSLFLISDPAAIQHVLQDQARRYTKQTFQYGTLSLVTGLGLLTSDGALWLRQRRLMQPAFHRRVVERYASSVREENEALGAEWSAAARSTGAVNVTFSVSRLALRVILRALFTDDLRQLVPDLDRLFGELLGHLDRALAHQLGRARTGRFGGPGGADRIEKALDGIGHRTKHRGAWLQNRDIPAAAGPVIGPVRRRS